MKTSFIRSASRPPVALELPGSNGDAGVTDYLLWYRERQAMLKYRQLYSAQGAGEVKALTQYNWVEAPDGSRGAR